MNHVEILMKYNNWTKEEAKAIMKINEAHDPDKIRAYADKVPTEAVRIRAKDRLEYLGVGDNAEEVAEKMNRAPKCPKCGKPMTPAMYYTAKRERA